jgi:hypothetical protein
MMSDIVRDEVPVTSKVGVTCWHKDSGPDPDSNQTGLTKGRCSIGMEMAEAVSQ